MATKRNNVSLAHDLEFISKDTGNLHIAADNAGVPIDVINVHRKKADIFLVVEK
jgi:hypothetical protein